jgi:glycoside hydrolase
MLNYKNPLPIKGKNVPTAQPDPYIIEKDGIYYIFATHARGVSAYSSDNLTDWKYEGLVCSIEGHSQYWAPCVIEYCGKFYLYFSSREDSFQGIHGDSLKVAVSERPLGPYRYIKQICRPFSIDPHVVTNTNGELFLFYSTNDEDSLTKAGTYIVADKLLDPFTPEDKPASILRPSLKEEIFEKDRFKKGQDWHTLEGAFYFRIGSTHYLMYSANAYTSENYFVGYAIAHGEENDLRKLRFTKYPDDHTYYPLLRRNEFVEGTGHNSLLRGPDGKLYIVYHGRDIGTKSDTVDTRRMRIDELLVDGDKLTVLGPTY